MPRTLSLSAPPRPASPPRAERSGMAEDRYHYRVIERAIALIDAAGPDLPLEALAARMGMSTGHFQRLFSTWAGVSPKRYRQYLTLDLARRLLAERHSLLDTAGEAGLSGTGRLHDLFLRWEAMSPGEFARAAEGLTIRWGRFDSPFGPALAMGTDRGLCGLGFCAAMGFEATFADLASRWPAAQFVEDPAPLAPWVAGAFAGRGEVPLQLVGGPFQIKVWEALLAVPEGRVTSYAALAAAIGQPRAPRAVGTALGRNTLALLIPCHRVLTSSGALGGYRWGLPVKRALLAREAARADAAEAGFTAPLAPS